MKFYEIAKSYNQLLDLSETLDPEVLKDTLEAIQENFEEKSINITKIIKMNEAEVDVIETEIKRLKERQQVINNSNDRLKSYLYTHMTATGIDKIKSPLFTLSITKNPPKTNVIDENLIPIDYKTFKTVISVDKKQILADLKEGKEIEGVKLVQDTKLTIK